MSYRGIVVSAAKTNTRVSSYYVTIVKKSRIRAASLGSVIQQVRCDFILADASQSRSYGSDKNEGSLKTT